MADGSTTGSVGNFVAGMGVYSGGSDPGGRVCGARDVRSADSTGGCSRFGTSTLGVGSFGTLSVNRCSNAARTRTSLSRPPGGGVPSCGRVNTTVTVPANTARRATVADLTKNG